MKTKPKLSIDIAKLEQLASIGLTMEQIANNLGISYNTLNNRSKIDVEIVDALKRGRDKGIQQVANALYENAMSGNLGAQIFFLKTKGGWKEQQDVNIKSEQPLQVVFKNDLKD